MVPTILGVEKPSKLGNTFECVCVSTISLPECLEDMVRVRPQL
jgi:hypothetical protein